MRASECKHHADPQDAHRQPAGRASSIAVLWLKHYFPPHRRLVAITAASTMFSATFSAAATVSNACSAVMSTAFAATVPSASATVVCYYGMSLAGRGWSAIAGSATGALGPSLVSRNIAAEGTSIQTGLRILLVAPVDVVRVVVVRLVAGTFTSPPPGTSSSPSRAIT